MIAYLEHFVHENEAESRPKNYGEEEDSRLCTGMNIQGIIDYRSTGLACKDFGVMHAAKPLAVVRPAGADDIARVVKFALRSSNLTVAARGNSHSINGQAMADRGLVINMTSMENKIEEPRFHGGASTVDVAEGERERESDKDSWVVLQRSVKRLGTS